MSAHCLPEQTQGWEVRPLGEVTKISSGVTLGRDLSTRATRSIAYLRVANVKDGWLDLSDVKRTPATEQEISDNSLAPGDILLTEGGDPDKLGRGTFWRGEIQECIHQNHIFRVRADSHRFDAEFLAFQFGSAYGKAFFLRHAKQTTGIATINKTVLSRFPLLIPPLAEQHRIAVRLREELSAVAQARAALEAQLAASEALPDACVREDAFDAETTHQPIREVMREVTKGIGEAWRNQPVLGATRAGLAPAKEGVGKHPGRYKPVTPGTVFYNPMRILLGSIALVDEGDTPGITSPDYVVMRGREGVLHPVWFYQWFRSSAGAGFIKSLTRGAVRERLLFNRVAPGLVPVPSWPRQLATVERIRAATKLRTALAAKLAEVEKLPAALLRAAFSNAEKQG